jgi:hypothetical protein
MARATNPTDWGTVVRGIYTEHNPSKLGNVPALLSKYAGREAVLVGKLRAKYNAPAPPWEHDDDDCMCGGFCIRDSRVWSCCGARAKAASCAGTVPPLEGGGAEWLRRVHHSYNGSNSCWTAEQRACRCEECTADSTLPAAPAPEETAPPSADDGTSSECGAAAATATAAVAAAAASSVVAAAAAATAAAAAAAAAAAEAGGALAAARVRAEVLDWGGGRALPRQLWGDASSSSSSSSSSDTRPPFDIVVGADVIFPTNSASYGPLADTLAALLLLPTAGKRLGDCGGRSGVECWLAYEPRKPDVEGRFWELLRARGLHASRLRPDELPPGSPPDIEILRIHTLPAGLSFPC